MTLFSGVADELSTLHGCLIDEFAFLDTALTAIIDGYAPKEDPERPWPRIFFLAVLGLHLLLFTISRSPQRGNMRRKAGAVVL